MLRAGSLCWVGYGHSGRCAAHVTVKFFPYRPVSRRQAQWIAVAAVATALTIVLTMLSPPGGVQRTRLVPAPPPVCADGQGSGCVGGKADVIALPRVPARPASAVAAGPAR